MKLAGSIATVALAPLIVLARSANELNLTLTLFPEDANPTCEENDSNGITFSTRSVPRYQTCIDVDAVFGGDSRVGFTNDSISAGKFVDLGEADANSTEPRGIHWYISSDEGPDTYNSSSSYLDMRIRQINGTNNGGGEGETGRWVITTYSDANCNAPQEDWDELPWFKTSCQTSDEGYCGNSPSAIKGIMIRGLWEEDIYSCVTWAKLGSASGVLPRAGVAILTAFAAFALM